MHVPRWGRGLWPNAGRLQTHCDTCSRDCILATTCAYTPLLISCAHPRDANAHPLSDVASAGFYTGPVAEAIVEAVKSRGGVLELGDLSSHATARVDPICTTYRWATAVSGRAVASCRPSHAAVACPSGFKLGMLHTSTQSLA